MTRHALLVLATTLTAQAFASAAILTLPAIAPAFAKALGVDPAAIGYQISVVYAGAMTSTSVGGGLVRHLGACRTTQVSLALCALGIALAAVPALPVLALASLLLGLGYGLSNPAAAHLLVRYTPERSRNLIFSIKQTGVPLGGMLTALAAPVLTLSRGWQAPLLLVAAVSLALALLMQGRRARWDDDRRPGTRLRGQWLGGIALIWSDAALRNLSLSALCFAGVQLCLMSFTVTLLVHDAGFGLVQAGLLLSLVQLAGFCGRIFWGWLADRTRRGVHVLILLGVLMLLSCLAVSQAGPGWPPAAIHAAFLLAGATAIGWNGVFLAQVARRCRPEQVSMATGGALFFTFAGVLLGPSAFALLYALLGSYALTFGAAALLAAGGIAFLARALRESDGAA